MAVVKMHWGKIPLHISLTVIKLINILLAEASDATNILFSNCNSAAGITLGNGPSIWKAWIIVSKGWFYYDYFIFYWVQAACSVLFLFDTSVKGSQKIAFYCS